MSTTRRRSASRGRQSVSAKNNAQYDDEEQQYKPTTMMNNNLPKAPRASFSSRAAHVGGAPSAYDGLVDANGQIHYTAMQRPAQTQSELKKKPPTPIISRKPLDKTTPTADVVKKSAFGVIGAISFYWVTSLATVFLNKYLLSGNDKLKNVPIFFTWFQTVFSIIASFTVSMISSMCSTTPKSTEKEQTATPQQAGIFTQCFQTLPVALLFTGMLLFGNLCLSYVNLPFYQVARSWTCIISIILSFFFFGTVPRIAQILSCMVIVAGYVLACDSELQLDQLVVELKAFSVSLLQFLPKSLYQGDVTAYSSTLQNESIVLGIVCGLMSSFMLALYSIMNKRLQNKKIMTNNQIVMWLNFNSAIAMFAYMAYSGEFNIAIQKPELYQQETYIPMLVVSLSGYLLNYATMLQIQYTSPLAHTISGTAKASAQTGIGWYLSPEPTPLMGIVGTLLTILGCFVYGFC